jgi:HEPN domain-containing protein
LPRMTDSGNPADWLWLAEDDLQGLHVLADQKTAYYLCISKLAEVTEKLIKAELIRLGWNLVKLHDLQKLNDELHLRNSKLAHQIDDLVEALSERYFTDRYPGFDLEEPDWKELRRLMAQVDALDCIVRQDIVGPDT